MKSDPMVREGYFFILFSLLQSEPTDNMMDEDDEDNMPIFGDDMVELMNSKSNYPMVLISLFRQLTNFQMMKKMIFISSKPML